VAESPTLHAGTRLARAFFRGAPLQILDEPTSALDAQAEYDVYLRFQELTRGRTTLLISHRFSTCAWPIASWCWKADASSKQAAARSWWHSAAATQRCTRCRPAGTDNLNCRRQSSSIYRCAFNLAAGKT
jgi:energy-coupling factor transporter ATP-binding protein EcfA2